MSVVQSNRLTRNSTFDPMKSRHPMSKNGGLSKSLQSKKGAAGQSNSSQNEDTCTENRWNRSLSDPHPITPAGLELLNRVIEDAPAEEAQLQLFRSLLNRKKGRRSSFMCFTEEETKTSPEPVVPSKAAVKRVRRHNKTAEKIQKYKDLVHIVREKKIYKSRLEKEIQGLESSINK